MRDYVLLYINGQRHEVTGADVLLSLSDYLRRTQGLIGTKIVCSEGDCGACSVLVGRPCDGRLEYRVIDSCIQFMFQLDSVHVVTVEGLTPDGLPTGDSPLHPVQQAMVDCHGSQCGFCTPGFVMSIAGLRERTEKLEPTDLRTGLAGNLCRCTGYTAILDAGQQLSQTPYRRLESLYPSTAMLDTFAHHAELPIEIHAERNGAPHLVACPTELTDGLEFLKTHPNATIVAGATDLGVRINKSGQLPAVVLDLNRIDGLSEVKIARGRLSIGARATWTAVEEACRERLPELHQLLTVFGSPQIRNAGTVGGNIVNASPIADSLPFLHVTEAMFELTGTDGVRHVNANDFFLGYKELDLHPGELLTGVELLLPAEDELLRLYKVSRRRDLDIASFTAAVRMRIDGGTIASASLALGAVGPTVIRARRTEAFLQGKPMTEQTMREAGKIAADEISPISDVRGSAEYRRQLARNVLLKFFYETQE